LRGSAHPVVNAVCLAVGKVRRLTQGS